MGARDRELPLPEAMMTATYMPDGKEIAAASDQSIILFNRATGHIRLFRRPGKADPRSYTNARLAVSPDGRYIAYYVGDSLIILSAAFGTLVASLQHDGALSCVAYSRDSTRIASGTHSGSVRLWDALTGAQVGLLEGDRADIINVSFLRDGTSLAATSSDGSIRFWDSTTYAPTATLKLAHPGGAICSVSFSPDSAHIVSGNEAGSVIIWDAREGTIVRTFDTVPARHITGGPKL